VKDEEELCGLVFTGFVDESGIVVMDSCAVQRNCFFRFFLPDFLSSNHL